MSSLLTRLLGILASLGASVRRTVRAGLRSGALVTARVKGAVRERAFPLRVRHVSGPQGVDAGPDEAVVVCLVRDGVEYLDGFFAHYRELGVRHVVLLDNGSTDGTVERASREPGVTVLQTAAPYKHYKVITKRYLVERFGRGCWVLCADIDELFDYPRRAAVPLRSFLRYLHRHRYTAVVAHLLDMFPSGPVCAGHWRDDHRFYDLSAVSTQPYREKYGTRNEASNDRIDVLYGGVREARFGVRPMLTKHPLQFPSASVRYVNSHNVEGARVADVSGVLLHFKYASGFPEYARRIVSERSFYNGSAEYEAYLDAITDDSSFELYTERARELLAVDQLLSEGLVAESEEYRTFASGRSEGGRHTTRLGDPTSSQAAQTPSARPASGGRMTQ